MSSNKDNAPKNRKTITLTVMAVMLAAAVIMGLNIKVTRSADKIKSTDEISVGQHLIFGAYEQDGNLSNGREPIEWRVLAIEDGKALVISEKLLDYQAYHNEYDGVTWETCTLRSWMNQDFFNAAFVKSEQKKIALVSNVNPKNLLYDTSGGKSTQDKIFALSLEEAQKYFSSNIARKAYVTEYAKKVRTVKRTDADIVQKTEFNSDDSEYWWLRSAGGSQTSPAGISDKGKLRYDGFEVNGLEAVRPALWLIIGDNAEYAMSLDEIKSTDEISVGQKLIFGIYEQDGEEENGSEAIEWSVLAIEDGKALLISKKLLDCIPYNNECKDVTWATSTLRRWLNEDFIDTAFTEDEQSRIVLSNIHNPYNPGFSTEGCENTDDKVFALSADEVKKYSSSDGDLSASVSYFAASKQYEQHHDTYNNWWLRTSGISHKCAATMSDDGGSLWGYDVDCDYVCIRPAMWVEI